MKKLFFILLLVITLFANGSCSDDNDDNQSILNAEIEQLKLSTINFKDFQKAFETGYNTDVTGYVPQMGYHYLKADLLDNNFEIENPEILQYTIDNQGKMKFIGVEYAIPVQDINNPPPAPKGFTGREDVWNLNIEAKLWTLHVWIELENPNGIFTDFNQSLTDQTWILELEQLKNAIMNNKDFDTAVSNGYNIDVTGYVPNMGHHFLNVNLIDNSFDLNNPEVIQFAPDSDGKMQFIGVEYLVPIEDINNPAPAPEGFTGNVDEWQINSEAGLWTLHVWVGVVNPDGVFSELNYLID